MIGLEVILMANEDKKDFNAMLMDSKDMPKDRKSTRLNSSHRSQSRMPSSA